jgi:ribonuclease HI
MSSSQLLKVFQAAQKEFDESEAAIYDEIQSRKVLEQKLNSELIWKRRDEAKTSPWKIPVYLSSGVSGQVTLGTVTVEKRKEALKIAQEASLGFQKNRLVLWSDASWKARGCAASVVYQNESNQWISWTQSYDPRTITSQQAEALAIEQAVIIGFQYISEKKKEEFAAAVPKEMFIFSDSQPAMRTMCKLYPETVESQIWDEAFQGIDIRIQWVPAHSQVRGNMIADRLARAANIDTVDKFKQTKKNATDIKTRILASAIFTRGQGDFAEKLKECYSDMMLNL